MIAPRCALNALLLFVRRARRDERGSIVVTFAVVAVALLGASGAAMDYAQVSSARDTMQTTADASALAGAKEFRLGNADPVTVSLVAKNFATNSFATQNFDMAANSAVVSPKVDNIAKTVTVGINATVKTNFMQAFGFESMAVSVTATAKVVGGAPICAVGLNQTANKTVLMDKNAKLLAPTCAVYSNSKGATGLMAKNNAIMAAAFICSAGGKSSPGPGSFAPAPQTDCPVLPDPLAARPQPSVGPCTKTNLVISGGINTLMPGTYCGGITITNAAIVTLMSGTYVLKDGPLSITGFSTLAGVNVGIFFSGTGAVIDFQPNSIITLTAPLVGTMAGLLFFEDRASPGGQLHQILSDNARVLLGTIYLPVGEFHVAANSPVADQAAYTIVIVNRLTLSEGPTMVLNSNYLGTNVPVPAGVGPNSSRTTLVN